eukprot:GHVU01088461.1.p1 GENE.GHVU01088461.1~~GHVU01088461.1.p1  ORF type:complete len:707 (-),score=82.66 GHVU01088461.1:1462-3483(-)
MPIEARSPPSSARSAPVEARPLSSSSSSNSAVALPVQRHRPATRSFDPNVRLPRFVGDPGEVRRGVLAENHASGRCVLTPAYDLGPAHGRGTTWVSWLRPIGENQWVTDNLGAIGEARIKERFDIETIDDIGVLPAAQLQRLQPSPSTPGPEEAAQHESSALLAKSTEDLSLYKEAILREYVSLLQHDVIGDEVPHSPRAMRMGWKLTMKSGLGDRPAFPKARWFCKGFMDRTPAETYAGTPDAEAQRIFLVYVLSRKWKARFLDAETAFLQAPILGDAAPIIILDKSLPSLPAESPFPDIDAGEWATLLSKAATLQPGQYRKLNKALYGDRRSPLFWALKLRSELKALGYEEIAESLFVRTVNGVTTCIVLCHVDDFSIGGDDVESEVAAIRKRIKCKQETQELKLGVPVDFLGSKLTKTAEGIEISNDHYLDNLRGEKPSRVVKTADLTPPEPEEVDLALSAEYRSLCGRLGWAVRTRPDQSVYFSLLSKNSSAPSPRHLKALTNVLLALKSTKCPLVLSEVGGAPILVCYSDAGFKLNNLKSRAGFKIYICDNVSDARRSLVSWCTKEISQLHDSSTSGELFALKMLVKHVWSVRALVSKLWGREPEVFLFVDNQPLIDQITCGRCKQEPSMQQHLDYVIQEINRLHATHRWCPRAEQKADAMTKPIWFA